MKRNFNLQYDSYLKELLHQNANKNNNNNTHKKKTKSNQGSAKVQVQIQLKWYNSKISLSQEVQNELLMNMHVQIKRSVKSLGCASLCCQVIVHFKFNFRHVKVLYTLTTEFDRTFDGTDTFNCIGTSP